MNITKKGFTLVELVVSIMIVAILASIWFYSYVSYLGEARDAERKANVWEIRTALKLYKQKRWAYPMPGQKFNITNTGMIVAYQWLFNEKVTLNSMDEIPKDPFTERDYFYSTTKNRQEFQISLTLENWEFPIALLSWDYKTVSYLVLPSIILATNTDLPSIEIEITTITWATNRNYFILDRGINLPYTIIKPYDAYYASQDIDIVLTWWVVNFWQNSDYRSCLEIEDAAKMIHPSWSTGTYQIVDPSTWNLTSTWCYNNP
mgnify:CR=1 FL=1